MEQQHLLDEMETSPVNKRPVFLTVICILTWVGSAGALCLYGYQFMLYNKMAKEMSKLSGEFGGDQFSNLYNTLLWSSLIGIIATVLCIAGSIVMFTRRKWGFYIYTVGEVVPLIAAAYITLSIGGGSRNLMSMSFMALSWIVPIGFIVMYALNMKHMRR
jgi:hypothetical protein